MPLISPICTSVSVTSLSFGPNCTNTMDTEEQDVAKLQVKFKTQLAKYKVTEKPFQVPVNLNRRGLSQVINHLLGTST